MLWDIEDSFRGFGKFLVYSFGVTFFIISHLIILLLAHSVVVSIQDGVNLAAAKFTMLTASTSANCATSSRLPCNHKK